MKKEPLSPLSDLSMDRRRFCNLAATGIALSSQALAWAPKRRLKCGHTGITWDNSHVEQAIQDCGRLGFHGFETFGQVLETWEAKGGLGDVLKANNLPLRSAYCSFNMTDPSKRSQEVEKMIRWGKILKKYGGSVVVIGPNSLDRQGYDFKQHKNDIVSSLDEVAKQLADIGVTAALHQHTGTCVMTRDEVYSVMEAVDTKYVKFGPDVGQLQKGGSDPVKVVQDFLPLIRHVHLKDFNGGEAYLGYCPLGQGKVDLPKIVDLLEGSGNELMLMAELDSSPQMPMTPLEAVTIDRNYLQKMGYRFG